MPVRALIVMLLAVGLAGCGDKSDAVEAFDAADIQALLQGSVVDSSITPVAGARIIVTGTDLNATSDESGGFSIEAPAGMYLLTTHKSGFASVQLEARTNTKITINMVRNQTVTPFVVATTWEGFLACSARVGTLDLGQTIGINACNGIADQNVEHVHEFPSGPPQWFQTELVWESTQLLGDELSLTAGEEDCLDSSEYMRADGPSPLAYTMDSFIVGARSLDEGTGTCSRVFAFTSGTVNHAAGTQVQQRFSTFSHSFYYTQPPAGWMFAVDGSPTP